MSNKSRLIKNTFIYAIGNLGVKILAFLIVPLYTYYILPKDLGNYDLAISTISLLMPVVTMQLSDAVLRWLLDEAQDEDIVISSTMSALWRNLLLALIVGIPVMLFFKIEYGILILLLFISMCIYNVLQQITRGVGHNKLYAMMGIVYSGLMLSMNFVQIVYLGNGVKGLLLSQLLAAVATSIIMCTIQPQVRKSIFKKGSKETQKAMIKYAIPLVPNTINWWIVNVSNRYIIRFFIGATATGIYAISNKFPTVISLFTSIFNLAWQESAIKEFNNGGRDGFYSEVFEKYYTYLFTLVICLIPFTKFISPYIINERYADSWRYTSFLYMGMIFSAFSSFLGTGYQSSKHTKGAFHTTNMAAIANVVINIMLIKFIGLYASCIATFFAYLLLFFVRLVDTKKYFNLKVKWKKFRVLFLIAIIYAILIFFTNSAVDIALTLIGIVTFLLVNRKDLILIVKQIIKKVIKK